MVSGKDCGSSSNYPLCVMALYHSKSRASSLKMEPFTVSYDQRSEFLKLSYLHSFQVYHEAVITNSCLANLGFRYKLQSYLLYCIGFLLFHETRKQVKFDDVFYSLCIVRLNTFLFHQAIMFVLAHWFSMLIRNICFTCLKCM